MPLCLRHLKKPLRQNHRINNSHVSQVQVFSYPIWIIHVTIVPLGESINPIPPQIGNWIFIARDFIPLSIFPRNFRTISECDMKLLHSRPRLPIRSGYITLKTDLRSYRRYISLSNTVLTYGHRPDRILWTVDLTECRIYTKGKTVCITMASGKEVKFRMTDDELKVWYPRLMAGSFGLRQYYQVGAGVSRFGGGVLHTACDRGDGTDYRVWTVDKRANIEQCCLFRRLDKRILQFCRADDRAITVADVFEDSSYFHIVTEVFRGAEIGRHEDASFIVKDVLGIVARLHEQRLTHGKLEEVTFVEGSRVRIMVYGYAQPGGAGMMEADVKAVGRMAKKVVGSGSACETGDVARVLQLLDSGTPANEVLRDAWFQSPLSVHFDALDEGDPGKGKVESPRSVNCPQVLL